MKRSILEAAKVVRSKNSGPFELTLDVIFKTRRHFELFRRRRFIDEKAVCRMYKVSPKDILGIIYFEPANAVKITIRRWMPSGSPGETDIYGAQQHAPLLGLTYDE